MAYKQELIPSAAGVGLEVWCLFLWPRTCLYSSSSKGSKTPSCLPTIPSFFYQAYSRPNGEECPQILHLPLLQEPRINPNTPHMTKKEQTGRHWRNFPYPFSHIHASVVQTKALTGSRLVSLGQLETALDKKASLATRCISWPPLGPQILPPKN